MYGLPGVADWRQITSNGITRSANFTRTNNKLLSVGEWKRRVLLSPSPFVDYLLPQIGRTQFSYGVATKLATQTGRLSRVSDYFVIKTLRSAIAQLP